MRVAIVCPYAWDAPGGVQTHIRGLGRALMERGHDVTVLAPSLGAGDAPGLEPFPLYSVGRAVGVPFNGSIAPISFGPGTLRAAQRTLAVLKPDVVHVHEPIAPSLSFLAAAASRVPVVATFHISARANPLLAIARRPLAPMVDKLAVRIAVSQAARRHSARYFPGDYSIVPNGIELDRFTDAEPLDELGPRPRVLFLGRLEPRKGLEVLIRALGALALLRPHLVVAGEGPEHGRARTLAAALGVRTTFLGRLDEPTKARVFRSVDVFCAPNLGGESFGIVLAEAMASGTPVVCSDLEGFREAAGDAALFSHPGRPGPLAGAIRRVLEQDQQREAMVARGRDRAAELDWGRVVVGVEEAYAEAVG